MKRLQNLDKLKKPTNLTITFYEDEEMRDIMKKVYQIKKNLTISFLFLIQHNCILSRQVVYKKAFDISRKESLPNMTPTHTNHKISISQITGNKHFYHIHSVI